MRNFDFNPLFARGIGFDRLLSILEAQRGEGQPSYPPYNIELVSDDEYRIVMAVAGFDRSEVEIMSEGDGLLVVGRKQKDQQQRTFLHRGIAARDFEQRFQLANHVRVVGASFENGMLTIDLAREVPEALKPRKIEISSGAVQTHTQQIEQRQAA